MNITFEYELECDLVSAENSHIPYYNRICILVQPRVLFCFVFDFFHLKVAVITLKLENDLT